MRKIKRKLSIILGVLLICSLAFFSGCGEKADRGYDDSLISPEWYSEKMGMKSTADYSDEYISSTDKSLSLGMGYGSVVSVEDMIAHSSLIIRGRVLGFDFLTIQHAFGDSIMPHTNYYVEVLDVLRGEPYDDKQVIVRTKGRENDDEIHTECDFDITVGNEYLFFLWMPKTVGTAYCTDEDYYAIVDFSAGYFEGSKASVKNADGKYVPKEFTPCNPTQLNKENLDYLKFTEEIKEYNKTIPVDENVRRKQVEEALANNLESGFISQEEYDREMANIGKYATILYYTQPGDVTVNP